MADTHLELGLLAKLVLVVLIVMIVAGFVWHGVTFGTVHRLWRNVLDRPTGRFWFRFILQPIMATISAIHDGREDARTGRSPYFMTMLRNPQKRLGRLREGLNATARIILLGLAMDSIYQVLVLKMFYPNEAVIVALLLAFAPYVIIRGLVARAGHGRMPADRTG
jgi:hypothetical protein